LAKRLPTKNRIGTEALELGSGFRVFGTETPEPRPVFLSLLKPKEKLLNRSHPYKTWSIGHRLQKASSKDITKAHPLFFEIFLGRRSSGGNRDKGSKVEIL
jgi:hypothetical protein